MRNSQPSSSSGWSNEYIVLRVSKDTALFLGGLVLLVTISLVVFLPSRGREAAAPENTPVTSAAPAPVEGPVLPRKQAVPEQQLPGRAAPAQAETTSYSVSAATESDRGNNPQPYAPPAAEPVTRTVVAFYPYTPPPQNALPVEPVPPDNSPSNQPADPSPPSNLDPPSNSPAPPSDATVPETLNGAGSSFPYPLYAKWFDQFHAFHPNVQFNYQVIGSGAGIKQLLDNAVDFAASDGLMNDDQVRTNRARVVYIPSVISAVVPIYNLPEVGELHFDRLILAGIYSGKIIYWNDRAIAAANPHADLPPIPIQVIHRSDGCGTTFIFTDYLSKVGHEWKETVGSGASVNWPVGLGAKGNEGVAALVKQAPGSIGYVDFLYALQNRVPFGSVRNRTGRFIKADVVSITAAAASLDNGITDFPASITDASGADAYPIAGFTWFLAPTHSRHRSEARDLTAFFGWMLASSQQTYAAKLGYAPLPEGLTRRVYEEISKIH